MFKKLLKYDLKFMLRQESILMGALIICACLVRLFDFINQKINYFALNILNVGLNFTFIILLIMVLVYVFISGIRRYYRNVLSDEGYLTHTLPVKKSTILLSKLISYLIVSFLAVIIFISSIFIAYLQTNPIYFLQRVLQNLINFIYLSNGWTITYAIIVMLIFVTSLLLYTIYVPMCLTLASLSNERRGILTIAYMIATWGVMQFINFIGLIIYDVFDNYVLFSINNQTKVLILLVGILIFIVLEILAMYFITLYILKKKLNLK